MQEASIHKPLVSVIMATYNSDFLTIVKSVHSILDQTLTDIELLLIDDSTDARSIMTIDTFERKHPQVRVIRSHTRLGFVPALNEGLRQAKGQFIARMDADDIAELTRLEKEVAFLNAHPDIAVVGTAIQLIDKNDQIVSSRSYPLSQNEIRKEAIVRCPLAHPTVLMRRQIVDEGYLYDETFKRSEDYELWLRLMKHASNSRIWKNHY
jgi:glycosyltransferase involved in cell wall biosynthesis